MMNRCIHHVKHQETSVNDRGLSQPDFNDELYRQFVLVPPPRLGIEQEGNQRKDSRIVNANRVATVNKASLPKTYKCHKYEHFSPERLMACSECTFITPLKHNLQDHINTHKGVHPYPLSLCDYRGTKLAMPKSHLKTHKKYSCADCGILPPKLFKRT